MLPVKGGMVVFCAGGGGRRARHERRRRARREARRGGGGGCGMQGAAICRLMWGAGGPSRRAGRQAGGRARGGGSNWPPGGRPGPLAGLPAAARAQGAAGGPPIAPGDRPRPSPSRTSRLGRPWGCLLVVGGCGRRGERGRRMVAAQAATRSNGGGAAWRAQRAHADQGLPLARLWQCVRCG